MLISLYFVIQTILQVLELFQVLAIDNLVRILLFHVKKFVPEVRANHLDANFSESEVAAYLLLNIFVDNWSDFEALVRTRRI